MKLQSSKQNQSEKQQLRRLQAGEQQGLAELEKPGPLAGKKLTQFAHYRQTKMMKRSLMMRKKMTVSWRKIVVAHCFLKIQSGTVLPEQV